MKILKLYIPDSINSITINDLNNKIIGIDGHLIIYQFVIAMQTIENYPNLHILAILLKAISYLKINIIPVFVFDGKAPKIKNKILNTRKKNKKYALQKLIEIDKDPTKNIEKIKLLKRTVTISYKQILEIAEILEILGIPCIIAPYEADSQLAYMSKNNIIDYVATEDLDLLPFGSKNIIKNFSKKNMIIINTEKIYEKLSQLQFIDLCILLGCDYISTIKGIGYNIAWKLINNYNSIDNIINNYHKFINGKYKIPSNYNYKNIRNYFYFPKYKLLDYPIIINKPDIDKLKNILLDKYNFKINYVNTIIKRITNLSYE